MSCSPHVALIVNISVRLTILSQRAAQLLHATDPRPSLRKPYLLAINYNKTLLKK